MNLTPGNAQHIGARRQQQDSFGFSDPADVAFRKHGGLLAVVADGMGGMAHGDAAARIAVKIFLESYAAKPETETIPDALWRSLNSANTAVFQLAGELGTAGETGTTLIATVVAGNQLHWVSAGDSGIFLFRDGEFTLVNEAHIYAHELDARAARGFISRQAALEHPEREALTSFLGLERMPLAERSFRPFHLRDHDIVLLATDGLFKTLTFAEMEDGIAAGEGDAQKIAETLVERTIAARFEFQDNVTVISLVARPDLPSEMPKRARTERPKTAAPVAETTTAAGSSLSKPPPRTLTRPSARIVEAWEKEPRPSQQQPKPSRTARALVFLGLAVAIAYAYYLFTWSPSPSANSQVAPKGSATRDPKAGGEAFDPAATPPVDRAPNQEPPPEAGSDNEER